MGSAARPHNANRRRTPALLARAQERLATAHHILAELQLMERWRAFGTPRLVGAAAYGLVVAPDIDLEITCEPPRVEQGFAVLEACARHPQVRKARFSNRLEAPDQGLYWQLGYLHTDGEEWKIDMWSLAPDHPGPTSAALVAPLCAVLTDETRLAILTLKTQALAEPRLQVGSIHIYRAVLEGGVRRPEQLLDWLAQHPPAGLTTWRPGM